LKLVYWDKTGFALWYKRLEKQKFKWPNKASLQEFELSLSNWIGCCRDMMCLVMKSCSINL
ncbi:IS66 family insertion sequence element accessory protein TnpB, partial [Veronia pacifica]|uniref:IS66 family insertion sequence element accessory protein TnpB n=1 Tax=Veronia pacifica TaxID=1080227 RepID=UPI001112E539